MNKKSPKRNCALKPRKGPFKYHVSKEVGEWGQKMAIFADLRTYHADVGGWVGPKKLKMG